MSRHNGLPGYDAWKTRSDLDDAGRYSEYEEQCWWCGGSGTVHCTSDGHRFPQEGERECGECGGRGLIRYDADGSSIRGRLNELGFEFDGDEP